MIFVSKLIYQDHFFKTQTSFNPPDRFSCEMQLCTEFVLEIIAYNIEQFEN